MNQYKQTLYIEDMQTVAANKGGKCLSPIYLGSRAKLEWECSEGHRFKLTPHRVRNQNGWCTVCNKRDKANKRLQLCKEVAVSRGGKLISDAYIFGRREKLLWECEAGHQFLASPRHVISGMKSWCPECKLTYSEKRIRIAFEAIFDDTFPNTRPSFLIANKGKPLELDGYNEALKLAFEFDGEQHFKPQRFRSANNTQDLEELKKRDELKTKLCAENNITILRFNYLDNFEDIPQLIKSRIPTERKDLLTYNFQPKPDYSTAYLPQNPLIELSLIAEARGGKLISTEYINIDTKLEWECIEGHRWWQKPDHIKNSGTWCAKCAFAKKTTQTD